MLDTRFWDKVEIRPFGQCWPWTGGINEQGYGRYSIGECKIRAHRYAYEQLMGAIPTDAVLDHICHNGTNCAGGPQCMHRSCCNPAHLLPSTRSENLNRSHRFKRRGPWTPAQHKARAAYLAGRF